MSQKLIDERNLVDRINDTEEIYSLIENASSALTLILYAPTGIGKSSLSAKVLHKIREQSDKHIIRVKTFPENDHKCLEEGRYVLDIFKSCLKAFHSDGDEKVSKVLTFDYYIRNLKNKQLRKTVFENITIELYGSNSKFGFAKVVTYFVLKRIFRFGEFNYFNVIKDNKPENIEIISGYIIHLLKNAELVFNIDNIQNIDFTSLKYFIDWLTIAKKFSRSFFIVEYTLSDAKQISSCLKFVEEIKESGCDTILMPIKQMEARYAFDALENLTQQKYSDDFRKHAIHFYDLFSEGNVRKLFDYGINLMDSYKYERFDPTLENLRSLQKDELFAIALLVSCGNSAPEIVLSEILINSEFVSNTPMIIWDNLERQKLLIMRHSRQVRLQHASIADTWLKHGNEFELYMLLAYRALEKSLRKLLESRSFDEIDYTQILTLLLSVYAKNEPFRIVELLDDLRKQIVRSVSPKTAWLFLERLIGFIQWDIKTYLNIYKEILLICYDCELFSEGYNILQLLDEKELLISNDLILMNALFMLGLDMHSECIKYVIKLTPSDDKRLEFCLQLINMVNYRSLNDKITCEKIAAQIEDNNTYPEYGYLLRLRALFLSRDKGLASVQESVRFFEQRSMDAQAAKSRITASYYLAITGSVRDAYEAICSAELHSSDKKIGEYMILNNKSAIDLLAGRCGLEIWNNLERAELSAVMPFDHLSILNNKLIWCLETKDYSSIELIINKIERFFKYEHDQHLRAFMCYNLSLYYRAISNTEKADYYKDIAFSLKEHCATLNARLLGVTPPDGTSFLLTKPWHVCFVSYWRFDPLI